MPKALKEVYQDFCNQEDYEDFEEFLKEETDLLKGFCLGSQCSETILVDRYSCSAHVPKPVELVTFQDILPDLFR